VTHIHPVLVLLLSLLIWSVLSRSQHRKTILFATVFGILLWSWPPVAWVISQTLEAQYQNAAPNDAGVGAIVVLGGGSASNNRTLRAMQTFYSLQGRVPVLASGYGFPTSDAELMRRQLEMAGVNPIWVEGDSRTTAENAYFSASILRAHQVHKIILVTDAFHMRRAEMCFRKQGFEVNPAPGNFQTFRGAPWYTWLLPNSESIQTNDRALHEWIGILVYQWKGSV
jgi:uncharacterized SAM-binding protein YcdF (DUF218 family)